MLDGPSFNVTSNTDALTLLNVATTTFDLTASKTQSWLTLSSTGDTIASAGSADLTFSINSDADSLAAGEYIDTVTITDTTNSTVVERDVVLTITRDVVEGFSFGGTSADIKFTPGVSTSTGYTWSGYHDASNLYLM